MNKKRIEQNLVVLLFVMVLVAFSLAQRETKKLERLYATAHLLQQSARITSNIVRLPATPTNRN